MKNVILLLVLIPAVFGFSACGDDSKATSNSSVNSYVPVAASYLHFTLPDQKNFLTNFPGAVVADEAALLLSSYTLTSGIVYDKSTTVSGYALEQFVSKDSVKAQTPDAENALGSNDPRQLYSVVIRSNNDGFDNRTKFTSSGSYNADLRWDVYIQGYLLDLNYSGKSFFPTAVGLAGMYNNKYAYDIYMFRKIDVKKPNAAGSLITFEIGATTTSYVSDTSYAAGTTKFTVDTKTIGSYSDVKVITLDQFLTKYVTDSPSSYTYKIVALDGSTKEGWTYDDMKSSYYLTDYDLIVKVDSSTNKVVSGTKINFPVRIEIISAAAVEYDGTANPAPAYASYL